MLFPLNSQTILSKNGTLISILLLCQTKASLLITILALFPYWQSSYVWKIWYPFFNKFSIFQVKKIKTSPFAWTNPLSGYMLWKVVFPRQRTLQLKLIKDPSATFQEANKHLQEEYTMKWINLPLGPSIKDVSPEGEGGDYPQKETWGDGGRDPV